MSAVTPDIDELETQEWLDALAAVLDVEGVGTRTFSAGKTDRPCAALGGASTLFRQDRLYQHYPYPQGGIHAR